MRSYPIYNRITRDYNSALHTSTTNFGARDTFIQRILVGTSATNSHELATIKVERHESTHGAVTFSLFLDGELIKRGHLVGKELQLFDIDKE